MRQIFLSATKASREQDHFLTYPPPSIDVNEADPTFVLLRESIDLFLSDEECSEILPPIIEALENRDQRLCVVRSDELAIRLIEMGNMRAIIPHCLITRSSSYLTHESLALIERHFQISQREVMPFLCVVLRMMSRTQRKNLISRIGFEQHFPFEDFILHVLEGEDLAWQLLKVLRYTCDCLEKPERFFNMLLFVAADTTTNSESTALMFECLCALSKRITHAAALYIELHEQISQYFRFDPPNRRGLVRFVSQLLYSRDIYEENAMILLEDLLSITKPTRGEVILLADTVSYALQTYNLRDELLVRFLRFLLSFFSPTSIYSIGLCVVQSITVFEEEFLLNTELTDLYVYKLTTIIKSITDTPEKHESEFFIHAFSILKALMENGVEVPDIALEKSRLLFGTDAELDELLEMIEDISKK